MKTQPKRCLCQRKTVYSVIKGLKIKLSVSPEGYPISCPSYSSPPGRIRMLVFDKSSPKITLLLEVIRLAVRFLIEAIENKERNISCSSQRPQNMVRTVAHMQQGQAENATVLRMDCKPHFQGQIGCPGCETLLRTKCGPEKGLCGVPKTIMSIVLEKIAKPQACNALLRYRLSSSLLFLKHHPPAPIPLKKYPVSRLEPHHPRCGHTSRSAVGSDEVSRHGACLEEAQTLLRHGPIL